MKNSIFYIIGICFALVGCVGNGNYSTGGTEYNETSSEYISHDNPYSNIDSLKPKNPQEFEESANKWNTSRKETRWQEYKGAMVRVEILLGDTDTREMRLRLMPNADGMDIDGDYRSILSAVADYEMKHVCGRNAENIAIIYDKPSFEVMRPSSYFDYKIEAEGTSVREYGFRCVYNK